MDPKLGVTAADLLNALPEKHLKNLLWEYTQENRASKIARAVAEARAKQPFTTTDQLVQVVIKSRVQSGAIFIQPTKTFMAYACRQLGTEKLETLLHTFSLG